MKPFGSKNGTVRQIEERYGLPIEEVLRSLYVDKNMPKVQMAQVLGVSYVTIVRWLDRAGVYGRQIEL